MQQRQLPVLLLSFLECARDPRLRGARVAHALDAEDIARVVEAHVLATPRAWAARCCAVRPCGDEV
eukprot:2160790-Prymnesium_polylepis.1